MTDRVIFDRGYRKYDGPRLGPSGARAAVYRDGVSVVIAAQRRASGIIAQETEDAITLREALGVEHTFQRYLDSTTARFASTTQWDAYTPYELRESDWDSERDRMADRVQATLERPQQPLAEGDADNGRDDHVAEAARLNQRQDDERHHGHRRTHSSPTLPGSATFRRPARCRQHQRQVHRALPLRLRPALVVEHLRVAGGIGARILHGHLRADGAALTGRWITDSSHQHNEIHDVESAQIIECNDCHLDATGSASAGLIAAVGIGRHPTGRDP